jgi:hypothetical protein
MVTMHLKENLDTPQALCGHQEGMIFYRPGDEYLEDMTHYRADWCWTCRSIWENLPEHRQLRMLDRKILALEVFQDFLIISGLMLLLYLIGAF